MEDLGLQVYLENFEAVNVEDTNIVFLVLLFHCFVDSLGGGGGGGEEKAGGEEENRKRKERKNEERMRGGP